MRTKSLAVRGVGAEPSSEQKGPTGHRLAEIMAGIVFSKVLVALALRIGFSELAGLSKSPSFGQAVGALVAGVVTLGLSCFAPFVLVRLFSLEAAHLEGLAHAPIGDDAHVAGVENRSVRVGVHREHRPCAANADCVVELAGEADCDVEARRDAPACDADLPGSGQPALVGGSAGGDELGVDRRGKIPDEL
jgi:hypothetical protein